MRRMIQFSVLLITIFVMLIISCNMPSDPFKKPSNSKARLFLEENEQTIDFGSEVKIGVSIFLAEHIEALHITENIVSCNMLKTMGVIFLQISRLHPTVIMW